MSHCNRKTFSCGSVGDPQCFCGCERCTAARATETKASADRERVMGDVLKDWERLKRFENNVRAVYGGRDLLGEIESMTKSRDEWSRIATEAQTKTRKTEAQTKTRKTKR